MDGCKGAGETGWGQRGRCKGACARGQVQRGVCKGASARGQVQRGGCKGAGVNWWGQRGGGKGAGARRRGQYDGLSNAVDASHRYIYTPPGGFLQTTELPKSPARKLRKRRPFKNDLLHRPTLLDSSIKAIPIQGARLIYHV